jgi:hypothetical protein
VTSGIHDGASEVEGVPYFLPTARIEVTLSSLRDEKGAFRELAVGVQASLVPDRAAGFVLNPDRHWLFAQDQTFKTEGGLLTLVSTKDEGKVAELVERLATTAANVIAFGAGGGLAPAAADLERVGPPETPPDPLPEEVLAVYMSISPGVHAFSFRPGSQFAELLVPGTGERLLVRASVWDVRKLTPAGFVRPTEATFRGVYARVLQPATVEVALALELGKLCADRARRIAGMERARAALEEQQGKDEEKLQAATGDERKKLEGVIQARAKEIEASVAARAAWVARVGDVAGNEGWASAMTGQYVDIGQRVAGVLVPDETLLVKVPIGRAAAGTTETTLTLASGVVAEFESKYPSAGLEVAQVPLKISDALLELPTKILQLKIDTTSKQKELTQVEKDLAELEAEIAAKPEEPTPEEALASQLEMRLEVLRLQAGIAELEARLRELEEEARAP